MNVHARFSPEMYPWVEALNDLARGTNVLLDYADRLTLLKYEGHEFEVLPGNEFRIGRRSYGACIGSFLDLGPVDTAKEVREYAQWCVYASHRLDFSKDAELDIFMPSSEMNDVFLRAGEERLDGTRFTKRFPLILTDEGAIRTRLREIARARYFDDVVAPFLDEQPTRFRTPKWRPIRGNMASMVYRYGRSTRHLPHGSFVYVGCRQEVYLLGVARDESGGLYYQGTYTASTRPPLYFSNNYLGKMGAREMSKPLWRESRFFRSSCGVNVARYRTSDPPSFGGKPFIFPQMGRRQNCKNSTFTGTPDIITGDLEEALAHFGTTDFAEYADLVAKYAASMQDSPPPSFERVGQFFI